MATRTRTTKHQLDVDEGPALLANVVLTDADHVTHTFEAGLPLGDLPGWALEQVAGNPLLVPGGAEADVED